MDSNMGLNNCLECISSCCKLEVDITYKEYLYLTEMGYQDKIINRLNDFLKDNPSYNSNEKINFIFNLYKDNYGILKKKDDGYCVFLDRKTRLCSIYEHRPLVCKEFSNESKRCEFKCID